MPRTSALPSEVSSLGSAALWGRAGSAEGQVDRWPGQPPPLLSAQEGLGLLGFIKAFWRVGGRSGGRSFWSLDSTGGGTIQTRSECLQPKISKEGQQ